MQKVIKKKQKHPDEILKTKTYENNIRCKI